MTAEQGKSPPHLVQPGQEHRLQQRKNNRARAILPSPPALRGAQVAGRCCLGLDQKLLLQDGGVNPRRSEAVGPTGISGATKRERVILMPFSFCRAPKKLRFGSSGERALLRERRAPARRLPLSKKCRRLRSSRTERVRASALAGSCDSSSPVAFQGSGSAGVREPRRRTWRGFAVVGQLQVWGYRWSIWRFILDERWPT